MKIKRLYTLALATLAVAGAANAGAEEIARAEKSISVDFTTGAKSAEAFSAVSSLTYSGQNWEASTGGEATVTASCSKDGKTLEMKLVDSKGGEGFFSFTPTSAGTWVLRHETASGKIATASFTVAGAETPEGEEIIAATSATVDLDLRSGTREISSGGEKNLRYSGSGWASAKGGNATVSANLEGGNYAVGLTLVDNKYGEGTFDFTPLSAGTWLLEHTDSNGGVARARFVLAGEPEVEPGEGGETSYEYVLVAGDAGALPLDLRVGTRKIEEPGELMPIVYSGNGWALIGELSSPGSVTIVASLASGEAEDETSTLEGEGTLDFMPNVAGIWNLSHDDGADILRAAFDIAESALFGTLENPYEVATDEELAAVAADGIYVLFPEGTMLNPPPGFRLVAVKGRDGEYLIVSDDTIEGGSEYLDTESEEAAVKLTQFEAATSDGLKWRSSLTVKLKDGVDFDEWLEQSDLNEKIYVLMSDDLMKLSTDQAERGTVEILDSDKTTQRVTFIAEPQFNSEARLMFFRVMVTD